MRPRIRDLGTKVAELRDRPAELIAPIDSVEPELPAPQPIDTLRTY